MTIEITPDTFAMALTGAAILHVLFGRATPVHLTEGVFIPPAWVSAHGQIHIAPGGCDGEFDFRNWSLSSAAVNNFALEA